MATATQPQHHHLYHQPFSNAGGLSNGHARYVAHRPAEDDDSIATEQFPEFDPSHDGSEEESTSGDGDGDGDYTHHNQQQQNGAASTNESAVKDGHGAVVGQAQKEQQQQQQGNRPLFDDEDNEDDHGLSPLDPRPEPDHQTHHNTSAGRVVSPVTTPPYWAHRHADGARQQDLGHSRNLSVESLMGPGAITLQDNEAEDDAQQPQRSSEETRTSYGRDRNRACWAKSVEVTDYVIVNGSATNIGAFVVWNIRVQTLSGPYMNIRKRYSEFDDFRHQLIQTFPAFEAAVPVLPRKSVISRFRPRFLEKRRAGLQYFLNCILLNPEFSGSPVLKEFLFS